MSKYNNTWDEMHSNFITPPDYVKTILIIGATDEQIQTCATTIRDSGVVYNIYLYNEEMDNPEWMEMIKRRADQVINAKLINPAEYFTK